MTNIEISKLMKSDKYYVIFSSILIGFGGMTTIVIVFIKYFGGFRTTSGVLGEVDLPFVIAMLISGTIICLLGLLERILYF